jgi:hypothetical protein
VFHQFFTETGGREWSESGLHSYSRAMWRDKVAFKQPMEDGSFKVGGTALEELSEIWSEFIKFNTEQQEDSNE